MVLTITPGYAAEVLVSGTSAVLTGQAMTEVVAHTVYQITDATKRVLDPQYAVTTSGTGPFTVNRLTGTLTFTNAQTPPVTVTGEYLPMAQVLYAHDYSISIKPKTNPTTPFFSQYQALMHGIVDASGTLSSYLDPAEIVALSLPNYFRTNILADATIAIKFYMNTGFNLVAWAELDGDAFTQAIDGVVDEAITWSGDADADGRVVALSTS